MKRILGAGFISLALACSSETPSTKMVSEEALALAVQQKEDLKESFDAERAALGAQIAELERENATLRDRLGLAEETVEVAQITAAEAAAEAERYQAGLGRAVEELNRQGQEHAGRTAAMAEATRAATAPRERAASPNVSYHTTPRISVVDRSVVASGRLHNSGAADAVGQIELTLVRNGEALETKTQPMTLYAGAWGEWSESWNITPVPNANYSVRARFVP